MTMKTYNRDAYIEPIPDGYPTPMQETHFLLVDLLQDDGGVVHQIVSIIFGENNAQATADDLNRWREQTKFQQ